MKKIQLFFALVFITLIIVMVIKHFKRETKLHGESLSGRVISVERGRKGYYHVNFIQNNKLRQIGFVPENDNAMISVGDSVYKAVNSDIFYVKKKEKYTLSKAEWKDVYISGKWEE